MSALPGISTQPIGQPDSAAADSGHEQARLESLLQALGTLVASLDYAETLNAVARVGIPVIAAGSLVAVLEGGHPRLARVAHINAGEAERLELQAEKGLLRIDHDTAMMRAISCREVVSALDAPAGDLELVRGLRAQCFVVTPLVRSDRVLGALALFHDDPGRRLTSRDMKWAGWVGQCAAAALDNARLHAEVNEVSVAKDMLMASVAHDLKNPLGVIRLQTEIVRRGLGPRSKDNDRLHRSLDDMSVSVSRTAMQIDELLETARRHMGQPPALNRQRMDIVALVREVVRDEQRLTDEHRIVVETHVRRLDGFWDRMRLWRVFANLLDNAIKYSEPNGVVRVTIDTRAAAERDWAVIEVRDWGVGIPAADLPHIFERFHRSGNVANHVVGSGLGLTGAQMIVGQHGGDITVSSAEGQGSTFTVRLPLGPPEAAPENG